MKELRPDVSNEDQTTLTKLVIETMKDANRQMLERADPSNTLQLVNTVVNAVAGKGSGESSAILTLVTAQLSSLREELAAERAFGRELLTKLTAPTGEKKSLKSEVTELAETMSALGYQRGGGKGGTDWGEAAVEIGKEVLKSLTALGTAIITKKPAQPNATQNQRPAPTIIEQPREIAGQAPAAPPAETAAPPEEAMNTIQTLSNQFGGLFDTAAPFLVDQFGVLLDGQGVYDHARGVLDELHARGKAVLLISNSGKRSAANAARLGHSHSSALSSGLSSGTPARAASRWRRGLHENFAATTPSPPERARTDLRGRVRARARAT